MRKERRTYRNLAATRTGVPIGYEIEDQDRSDTKFGMWIVVIAVVIAFAMALQMETENQRSKKPIQVSRQLWAVN